jgi:hypothetical protein
LVKYLSITVGILTALAAFSQNDILISGGLHTVDVGAKDFLITNKSTADSFGLKFENASYGFHIGGGFRFNFRNFYLQPELIFNSNKANFKFTDYNNSKAYDSIRTEKYQYLDIPFIIGLKFSVLRILAGPVAHVFINNSSELINISGYKDKFKTTTFGYQAGIGFDLKFLSLDIRHEGNFSDYGDHINFFGSKLNFDNNASRLIGTLTIRI